MIVSSTSARPAPVATPSPSSRRTVIAIVIILVVALGSIFGFLVYAASTNSTVVAKKNFSYPEQPGPSPGSTSMSIVDVNGNINLVTWTQTSILINGTVTARGLSANPSNVLLVESHDSSGGINFYVQFPNQQSFFVFQNYEVSITIYVPSGLLFGGVKIATVNGGVSVQAISANNLGLTTTNGEINFHCGTCGNVTATTTNGSVTGTFSSALLSGTYTLTTVNGSASVTVPSVSSFKLDAKTTNGSVTTTGLTLTNLVVQTSSHVSGTIGSGNATMVCTTVNGSITVMGS